VLRWRWLWAVAALPVAVVAWAVAAGSSGPSRGHTPHRTSGRATRAPAAGVIHLGRSVAGRPIDAAEVGQARRARADLLVVGCIHGNEPAGIRVTRQLRRTLAGQAVDAWLIDDLNPDGRARDTRQNGRGVDLNRNFPFRWQPLGPRGTQQYAGRRPLSEPESRIAYRLILRIRPRITIWFHQPLGLVDQSGGQSSIERRFSRLVGLPLRRLTRYPGSATGWENHAVPGSTAFVVELPPGSPSPARTAAIARAVATVAR
jgi:protein MpaA